MDDLSTLLPLLATCALAGTVQGSVGFGFGLVSMGILPLFLPLRDAVITVSVCATLMNAILVWRLREHAHRPEIQPLLLGAALGVPVGVWLLVSLDARWLLLTVGIALVSYALWGLLSRSGLVERGTPRLGYLVGVAGGLLGGATGTSGPPMVVYVSWRGLSKEVAAATLQGVFLAIGIFQLLGFWVGDVFHRTAVLTATSGIPASVVGVALGQVLFRRMSGLLFRRVVLVGLVVLGGGLIARALDGA